jgi:trehalose 6-phosphate synthase/phosphatase
MAKTIIVSNRLPVKVSEKDGELQVASSEGGLATGLGSIYKQGNNVWIGWPGIVTEDAEIQHQVTSRLEDLNLFPVFLTQEEINQYYEGFSNEVLWPIFHYMPTYANYNHSYWTYYCEVNKKFAAAIQSIAEPNDIIWIQDYQLLLLPNMIREKMPDVSVGFFQHIPFPSFELFRLIPWRNEILEGMLGADLIGFHTFDDARHFVQACRRLLPVQTSANEITVGSRAVVVDTFPMGIDFKKFNELPKEPLVQVEAEKLRDTFSNQKMVLSIDRLDYSKGILQRLQAFEWFLNKYPDYIGKTTLYMVVVPSRDTVPKYKELRDEIDKFVGNINARYRTLEWQPVYYFYRSFPVEVLSALYNEAEVCLVTPMRDGMNLVCKEYVASRVNNDGVLILSEMAGASKELIDALIVNPNNVSAITNAIKEAIEMPSEDQDKRMRSMRQVVKKFDINHWVKIFMERLNEVKSMQTSMYARRLNDNTRKQIIQSFSNAKKRLLFLDYDGTLVGFKANIEQASPDKELYSLIESLIADPLNDVVIVSGRNYQFLQKWFGHLDINLIAEHGAWTKVRGEQWESIPTLNDAWKKDFFPVLDIYTDRTPGSFIEEKDFSLVWHFRKVEEELGELRKNELLNNLRYLAEGKGLQLLPGNKVVEIKNIEINKGKSTLSFSQRKQYDFIIAIGDDHTDEDIFKALPESTITIKVGSYITAARYYLNNFTDVRRLLGEMVPVAG